MTQPSLFSRIWLILTSGFAVFSMFFGSGNLVFPITLGKLTGSGYHWASLGLLFSGIFIPALGLIAILLYKGSVQAFFETLDKKSAFLIPFIMLCLLGPFGVIPRCITVAFGGIDIIFPGQSYTLFSFLFCLLTYIILLSENKLVDVIGGFLTPFLLAALLVIIISALTDFSPLDSASSIEPLWYGIKQGYQMMDLLAAFFFAATIMQHMNNRIPTKEGYHFKFTLAAISIGGFLLAIIYMFMVYLGALYANDLSYISPEQSIAYIAKLTLGKNSSLVVSIAVIMACLTTAVALAKVSVRFTQNRIFNNHIHPQITTVFILGITFIVSLLKFEGIANILGPILEILYPGLILLTILNIVHHFRPLKFIALLTYLTFIISAIIYFVPSF